MNDYNRKVLDYLESIGVTCSIKADTKQDCPDRCKPTTYERRKIDHNHGYKYSLTLMRKHGRLELEGFYNSIVSRYDTLPINVEVKAGSIKATPDVYDMLSCGYIPYAYANQETFEEYCSNFGFDTDSRKAERTYLEAVKQAISLQRFFTADELTYLQEVCQ